jgi:hypothetical protein
LVVVVEAAAAALAAVVVFLEKLVKLQLFKEFPASYGSRRRVASFQTMRMNINLRKILLAKATTDKSCRRN